MARRSKHPSSSQASIGNGRDGKEGTSFGWLAYDQRTFGEILSDWQQSVSPGEVRGFLSSLHLDTAISSSQFTDLVAGSAAPSRELVSYLSACVPDHVTSRVVMRNRGNKALTRADGKPIISPSADQILTARDRKLAEIAQRNSAAGNPAFDTWRDDLVERLSAATPDEAIDVSQTFTNLAGYLNIDRKVLDGQKHPSPDQVESIASELAQLLKLEGSEFDQFVDATTSALSSNGESVASKPFAGRSMLPASRRFW